MGEIISTMPLTSGTPSSSSSPWSAFELLLVGVICTLAVWYMQFHWNRRKFYEYARKVPGPKAYPFIGCSYLFIGTTRTIYRNLQWIMETYPDLARVWHAGRLFYMVTQPKHLELIMTQALQKEELYKYAMPAVGHGIFTAPVSKWKKNRKLIMPSFNQRILDDFVEVFSEQSEIFLQLIKPLCGKKDLDLFDILTRLSLDVICETAMGIQVHAQTTDNIFGSYVDKHMGLIYLRMFLIHYHYDLFFNLSSDKKMWDESLSYINKFTMNVINDKRAAFEKKLAERRSSEVAHVEEKAPKRMAFLDYLLELSLEQGQRFSNKELQDEVHTIMIAGSDTTATTICFVLTALGMYPEIQQKVLDEILDIVGPDRRVEPADLPKLNYMERVIKESLRLFPVASIIVRAIEEDLDLKDGYILPAGSSAVIGILTTHRSERYWKDPLKFDPDRFLPEENAKRHPCAYIPFSYGPRNCIGGKYAMMTIKTILATIVRSYKIHCEYKEISEIELKSNLVLRAEDGHKVSFEDRHV